MTERRSGSNHPRFEDLPIEDQILEFNKMMFDMMRMANRSSEALILRLFLGGLNSKGWKTISELCDMDPDTSIFTQVADAVMSTEPENRQRIIDEQFELIVKQSPEPIHMLSRTLILLGERERRLSRLGKRYVEFINEHRADISEEAFDLLDKVFEEDEKKS